MTGPYRLPSGGGLVDRSRLITFAFNNRAYRAYHGDTLASGLLANGIRTVARSFKFHRPRGVFSCGVEEPNALVEVGVGARVIPSARAPSVELSEGLEAHSQQGWPSLRFDLGRVLDWTAPLWSAGFYNKTFIWPRWHTYEGVIRRLAGLGRAPREPDPDRYDLRNLHCDVLVVGGGRTGLSIALDAARAGARVVLVEQDRALGGKLAWDGASTRNAPRSAGLPETTLALACHPDIEILTRTTAVGCYDHNVVALLERVESERGSPRERYWIVRAARIVLATGSVEQPLIFDHNDRPGIMLAGAARQYLRRYGVSIGSRILIATNNDSAYALAEELKAAGVSVMGVADTRTDVPEPIRRTMRSLSIEMFPGCI